MLLASGARIGPYEIVAPLGLGGMGEVYRARDARLSREVAIKGLSAAFSTDLERLARFRREAQTLASLNHPNIAAIYGFEEADGAPYLVLELVTGETLAARLKRGPLPVREAVALCAQIAAAIEAAHERGVVHRDLKPGNVMLTPSGVAKVLDFGLAKLDVGLAADPSASSSPTRTVAGGATVAGVVLGTAAYMSPEQARGKLVDRRSDVWSFGCVVFECLAGRAAFTGETVSDLIAHILEREPDWTALPAGTPPRLRELVRRCLRKDSEARPRDIRDVRLELLELASGAAEAKPAHEQSVAVLPFANLSGADDEYFADGVTDEILNALAHLEGLRVAARTSCFAFKGKHEDLRVVGERLDVTNVIEGTVRRAGSRLRITVQLVNAADGYQLWSERYDREMTDVFAVQEEIAKAIASRLRGTLHPGTEVTGVEGAGARRGTANLEAYELLLKGRALQVKRGRFISQARACFERAIALDPHYADALASLSDSCRLMGVFGSEPPSAIMPKAKDLAERALAIDPGNAEAWATLATVEEQYERDYDRGRELWTRALTIDPRHARIRAQRALWAFCRGEFDAEFALAEMRQAVQDDPLNSWVGAMNSQLLGYTGRHPESLVEAERSFALDAESFFAHWNLLRAHAWIGHYQKALGYAPDLYAVSGRHQWALGAVAWTYGKMGRPDSARAVWEELEARGRLEHISMFWLAVAAASSGDMERAIHYVDRTVKEHEPLILWGRSILFWDTIRQDPRFEPVVAGVWT